MVINDSSVNYCEDIVTEIVWPGYINTVREMTGHWTGQII